MLLHLHVVPVHRGDIFQRHHAGVECEHVDPIFARLVHLSARASHGGKVGEIAVNCVHVAEFAEPRCGIRRALRWPVERDDARTARRVDGRGDEPDSRRGSRDHDGFVFEPFSRQVLRERAERRGRRGRRRAVRCAHGEVCVIHLVEVGEGNTKEKEKF